MTFKRFFERVFGTNVHDYDLGLFRMIGTTVTHNDGSYTDTTWWWYNGKTIGQSWRYYDEWDERQARGSSGRGACQTLSVYRNAYVRLAEAAKQLHISDQEKQTLSAADIGLGEDSFEDFVTHPTISPELNPSPWWVNIQREIDLESKIITLLKIQS